MQNVNDLADSSWTPGNPPPAEDAEIAGWVRWWHWLIVVALFIAALVYYPVWRFEQKWKQLQVGDTVDRMKELLGDPGKASYSVQGTSPTSSGEAYIYTKYWKNYEVLVSPGTQRITAKTVMSSSTH
jgi:hypothetical protein